MVDADDRHRGAQPLGQLHRDLCGATRQQQRKLVAAEPGHEVAGSDLILQGRGHLAQHAVAGGVAEAVVDLLEVVQVDEQQRSRRPRDSVNKRASALRTRCGSAAGSACRDWRHDSRARARAVRSRLRAANRAASLSSRLSLPGPALQRPQKTLRRGGELQLADVRPPSTKAPATCSHRTVFVLGSDDLAAGARPDRLAPDEQQRIRHRPLKALVALECEPIARGQQRALC